MFTSGLRRLTSLIGLVGIVILNGSSGVMAQEALIATPALLTRTPRPSAWSQPIQLSTPGLSAWFPAIAVDGSGRVHVVWSGCSGKYDIVVYTSRLDSEHWIKPNDVVAVFAAGVATRPSLAIDARGSLNMTFRGSNQQSLYFGRTTLTAADSAVNWQTRQFDNDQPVYFSDLVVARDGVIHVIFTMNTLRGGCPQCFHVYYTRSPDQGQTWSAPREISTANLGIAKPKLVMVDEDILLVPLEIGDTGGDLGRVNDPTHVGYLASYDGGETWGDLQEFPLPTSPLPPEDYMARNLSMSVDHNQHVVAAWWSIPDDVVYYRVSTDQARTWSDPQVIPDITGIWEVYQSRLDRYAMATDSAGHIHLVMAGRRDGDDQNLGLFHLEWDGAKWLAPNTIVTYTGEAPEWPQLVIGNGNQLHLTWFVRDAANIFRSDQGKYSVWYSTFTASAPYRAPQLLDTPEPHTNTSTPIVLVTQAPLTSTPLPTLTMTTAGQEVRGEKIGDGLIIVASLLPALGLIILSFVLVHYFRR